MASNPSKTIYQIYLGEPQVMPLGNDLLIISRVDEETNVSVTKAVRSKDLLRYVITEEIVAPIDSFKEVFNTDL